MTERQPGDAISALASKRVTALQLLSGASLAVCVLTVLISDRPSRTPPSRAVPIVVSRPIPRLPRTPSEAFLREAQGLYLQAVRRVKPELEARAEADPDRETYREMERRRMMATEEAVALHRAAHAARRAASLAR